MQFSDIIGQSVVKHQLVELVHHNRLGHALLFLGKEGSGALPLAVSFAQFVVCNVQASLSAQSRKGINSAELLFDEPISIVTEKTYPADSCGICPSCIKAAQFVHPDIHFSYPTVTRKAGEKPVATDFITDWREFVKMNPYGNLFDWIELIKEKENSQGKITAEECNEIVRKLSLKSFESEYKILIMWMPEMMGTEGNKLLKLIEEPPPNTLFILVSENEAQILPTIVSRCQLIKIPALETPEIEEALITRNKTEKVMARQAAGVCSGNYREALQVVQHAEDDWQALLRDWLNAILKTGPVAQTKWVEEIGQMGREKQKQFLRYFSHLLEQSLRLRILQDNHGLLSEEMDFAQRLNKIAGIEQQEAISEELDRAIYHIERNAHGKILFHALTIRLYHIIQDKVVFLEN